MSRNGLPARPLARPAVHVPVFRHARPPRVLQIRHIAMKKPEVSARRSRDGHGSCAAASRGGWLRTDTLGRPPTAHTCGRAWTQSRVRKAKVSERNPSIQLCCMPGFLRKHKQRPNKLFYNIKVILSYLPKNIFKPELSEARLLTL